MTACGFARLRTMELGTVSAMRSDTISAHGAGALRTDSHCALVVMPLRKMGAATAPVMSNVTSPSSTSWQQTGRRAGGRACVLAVQRWAGSRGKPGHAFASQGERHTFGSKM